MDNVVLSCLRALKDALCPDGMVALQIGGIGGLPTTPDGESRIIFVNEGIFQSVTLTDDEWELPESLVTEIVDFMCQQREEQESDFEEEGKPYP